MADPLALVYSIAMSDFTRDEVVEAVHKLIKADLQGIDLSGADLYKANLTGANLSRANLREAKYDKHTKFPDGFDPEAAGMVLVE